MSRRYVLTVTLVVGLTGGLAAVTGPAQAVPARAAVAADCPYDDASGQIASSRSIGLPSLPSGGVDVQPVPFLDAPAQQLTGSAGSGFGASVAVGFLDEGHCSDLAVGAPTTPGGGAVELIPGSDTGFVPTATTTISALTPADRYGAAVALGARYTGGGGTAHEPYLSDLWVGAPGRTVDGKAGAGAIDHYVIPDNGSPALVETITAASPVIGGVAATGEAFGSVLSAAPSGLLIGVPNRSVSGHAGAGAAIWLGIDPVTGLTTSTQTLTQDSPGVPGAAEEGDHFGAAVSVSPPAGQLEALVGVPGEDVGTLKDAGMAQPFLRTAAGTWSPQPGITQNSAGVPGVAEAGDDFGAAVVVGGDQPCLDAMMVGSPGEDLGSVKDAGAATWIEAHPTSACPDRMLTQGSGGLGGAIEAGDHVGATLSVLSVRRDPAADVEPSGTYLIGDPGEDLGSALDAGLVIARTGQLASGPVTWTTRSFTDTAGPQAGLHYGSVLPTVDTEVKL